MAEDAHCDTLQVLRDAQQKSIAENYGQVMISTKLAYFLHHLISKFCSHPNGELEKGICSAQVQGVITWWAEHNLGFRLALPPKSGLIIKETTYTAFICSGTGDISDSFVFIVIKFTI